MAVLTLQLSDPPVKGWFCGRCPEMLTMPLHFPIESGLLGMAREHTLHTHGVTLGSDTGGELHQLSEWVFSWR